MVYAKNFQLVDLALVLHCCWRLRWQRAIDLISAATTAKLEPTLITYNAIVSACAGCGQWESAFGMLNTMDQQKVECSVISYTSAISACNLDFANARVRAKKKSNISDSKCTMLPHTEMVRQSRCKNQKSSRLGCSESLEM